MLAIEAIKEKLEETRKLRLEDILKISGSSAISKNDYNITIVEEADVATSLVFKSLTKDKYDQAELTKAIDVSISELKPILPTTFSPKVDLADYNDALNANDILRRELEGLQNEVVTLNGVIGNLRANLDSVTNEKLSLEQINDALVNQITTLSQTLDDFASQIQNAIQKSVDESILRTSLQAQNAGFKAQIEALIKQIDSLNSIIEGLQSQLGAVQQQQVIEQATQNQALESDASVINDVVIAKFIRKQSTTNEYDLYAKIKENRYGKDPDSKWINGEGLLFINNDKSPVRVNIELTYPENGRLRWFAVSNTDFEVPANSKGVEIKFNLLPKTANGYDSKPGFLGYGKSKNYTGELRATVTRADGTAQTKTYKSLMIKSHPNSYGSND